MKLENYFVEGTKIESASNRYTAVWKATTAVRKAGRRKTQVQLCIVHMVRNSLRFVPYKDSKAVTSDLKKIYLSASEELVSAALDEFSQKWDKKYPAISRSWKSRWSEVVLFLKFSPEIRKAVYTTNAIESLNYSIRKITKNRSSFPNDEAAMKLIFMGLLNISKRWTMPLRDWTAAINQFVIIYGDRFPCLC